MLVLWFLSSQPQSNAKLQKVWPRTLTSLGQGDLGIKQYQTTDSHDSDMNVASLLLLEAFWLSSGVSPSLSLSISPKETTARTLRLRVHKDHIRTSGGSSRLFASSVIFTIRSGTAVDLPAVRKILTAECVWPRGCLQTVRWVFLLLWELMIYFRSSAAWLWQVLL